MTTVSSVSPLTESSVHRDVVAEFSDTARVLHDDERLQRPTLAGDAPEWDSPAVIWLDDLTAFEPACTVSRFWEAYEWAAERGVLIGRWLDPRRIARIDAVPEGEESLALEIFHSGAGPAELGEACAYVEGTARCLAIDEMVVYHGTTAARASLIRRFGLVSLSPSDAYNPSGPGPFVADEATFAFLFACRAAARELSLDQLRVLPAEIPVSILAMRTRAGRLIPVGDSEYRVRSRIDRSDVLEIHHINAREFFEGVSLEQRVMLASGRPVGALARVEGFDSTPDAALPAVPDLRALVDVTINGRMGTGDAHGFAHAVQVADLGLQLSGPDVDGAIVLAFALLHDAARADDGRDVGHGARAADLARELEQSGVLCFGDRLDVLCAALSGHQHGEISDDPTVAACWDADRLALRRFDVVPDPDLLSSRAAREMAARGVEMSVSTWPEIAAAYAERFGGSISVPLVVT